VNNEDKGAKVTASKPTFDMSIDLKTLLQIGALVGAIAAGYVKFQGQVDTVVEQVGKIHIQTERMEHYLESSDPQYWQKAHQRGDHDEEKE
jgi:hypothetical protein